MSLTDPIDCLPIPWTEGACSIATTGAIKSNWINLLTLDEFVALWSTIESFEFYSEILASGPDATESLSGPGNLDASSITPKMRICQTLDFEEEVLFSSGSTFVSTVSARSSFRNTGGIEIITTEGEVFYPSPVTFSGSAVARKVTAPFQRIEESVFLSTVDETTLGDITGRGTITIAGVTLEWIRTLIVFGDTTGLTAEVGDPTATASLWTFDGTIN